MAPFPGQRPQSTQVIIQRLERLPLQTKIERLVKSKLFKISLGILGIFSNSHFEKKSDKILLFK
jgi:hypothetical protein